MISVLSTGPDTYNEFMHMPVLGSGGLISAGIIGVERPLSMGGEYEANAVSISFTFSKYIYFWHDLGFRSIQYLSVQNLS